MLQCADNPDLFPVAEGQILDLLFRVQRQPFAQLSRPAAAVLFPQPCGQLQHIPDPHTRVECIV